MSETLPPAWTDNALVSGRDDTLGRLPYAKAAAALISATHNNEASVVYGLTGPWGSGKTSLINMITEDLSAQPSWTVTRFSPWATSDVSGLLAEFYAALSEALPGKRGENARRALSATMRIASPAIATIPYIGASAAEAAEAVASSLGAAPPWQQAFDRAATRIRARKRPILVVVDDIDRLHSDELMALLKVVRLLGRFPGVDYLLAYDDVTLLRTLSSAGALTATDGTAERFMEKIVQYPLFVPPLLQHQLLDRLNKGLALIPRIVRRGADDTRLSALVDCFIGLLRTPRAIDRYVAQLQHHLPLVPEGEIDDDDVKLLTLVRISFPALFSVLPHYRSQLLSGSTGELSSSPRSSGVDYEPFDISPLLDLVPTSHVDVARKLLTSLFPELRAEGDFGFYGSRTTRGVANEHYFDRYFAMGLPEHDVSDVLVERAVDAASSGEPSSLVALLAESDPSKQLLVISKASSPSIQPASSSGRLHLAKCIATVATQVRDEPQLMFSARDRVVTWLALTIASLESDTSRDDILSVLELLNDEALCLHTWKFVLAALKRTSTEEPGWAAPVTRLLSDQAVAATIAHLEQGDLAPLNAGIGTHLHFALSCDRGSDLRSAISRLVSAGQVDAGTVASRIVSVMTLIGGKPQWELSSDFDQATFDVVMPPGDDPFYSSPVIQDLDVTDLSWANRRRMASGRVRPPKAD